MEKYTVLVIEDDENTRKQLAKVIQKEGFEVFTVENGQAGMEIFEKEFPEIVITDLKMPALTGLEVMHRVKRLSPHVQVILVTAYGDTEIAITALREGALDYLKKPLDLAELTLALGRAREKIDEHKKTVPFPTLLLAEDEDITRKRLAMLLEKEGWKVFQSADGEEAMDIFHKTKIDIALLDIRMPKKDGLQILHEMRGITHDFEAVIFSGYGDESAAIQAMRDGAINFLKKPIDLDQLIIAVGKALERLNLNRALKYRIRELELAKEVIARITAEKEIIIDMRDHARKPAREFAQKLLDAIPVALVVVDRDMKIRYVNQKLSKVLEYRLEKIDEKLVKDLGKIGIQGLSCESLKSTINKIFESPLGTVETISLGRYAYLTLVSITVLQEERKEEVILITIRGERQTNR